MCDSHYRTITGLESLVQKEWVAMGHPFTSRSGLVTEGSTEDDEGKVSYYTLSPVVVTEFAVTTSHKIVLLKYLCTCTCTCICGSSIALSIYKYTHVQCTCTCIYGSSIALSIYKYTHVHVHVFMAPQ